MDWGIFEIIGFWALLVLSGVALISIAAVLVVWLVNFAKGLVGSKK
jgi:hypothetical protein